MAFPTTSVLDTFNRTDGALGANWTAPALGDAQSPYIETNAMRYPNTGQASGCWNGINATDVEVYYTMTALNVGSDYAKLIFRASTGDAGATTSYNVRVLPISGNWLLQKRVAGVESTVSTFAALQTLAAGDSIGVSCSGAVIELWHKPSAGSWTLKQSTTDGSISSAGYIGVGSGTGITVEPRVDDFGGGAIVSSSLPSDTPFPPLGRGASW